MKAVVNKIIPFSTVDGPGNRTAVFLQGCNINCKYCHNPETRGLCVHCGNCVKNCPVQALTMEKGKVIYRSDRCIQCDQCIKVCNYNSSPKTQEMTAAQVFDQVKKQIPFIRGITVSGGECTLYPEFLTHLFELCKAAGLSTLLDSNGTLDFEKEEELLRVTDGVMLDIKAFDQQDYFAVTDGNNEIILKNAVFLAKLGKLYEVRTVIVPGLFDAEKTIRETARLLKPYLTIQDIRYKLISYRPMGVRKEFSHYQIPERELLEKCANILVQEGFKNSIIL